MIKEGLIRQATGVQLLMDAMEQTPAKELPSLMQRLQKEFRPVGVTSHSVAPAASMSMPSSTTASTASATTTSTTPKATIKAWGPLPGATYFTAQSGRGCGLVHVQMSIVRRPPHCHNQRLQSLYQQASGAGAAVYGLFVVLIQSGHTEVPHAQQTHLIEGSE